jgi:hypothetical protein
MSALWTQDQSFANSHSGLKDGGIRVKRRHVVGRVIMAVIVFGATLAVAQTPIQLHATRTAVSSTCSDGGFAYTDIHSNGHDHVHTCPCVQISPKYQDKDVTDRMHEYYCPFSTTNPNPGGSPTSTAGPSPTPGSGFGTPLPPIDGVPVIDIGDLGTNSGDPSTNGGLFGTKGGVLGIAGWFVGIMTGNPNSWGWINVGAPNNNVLSAEEPKISLYSDRPVSDSTSPLWLAAIPIVVSLVLLVVFRVRRSVLALDD